MKTNLNAIKFLTTVFLFCCFFFTEHSFGQTRIIVTSAGTTSFTAPTGVTRVTVQAWGAGGAGGGSNINKQPGSGGGGGAYNISNAVTVIPGTIYTNSVVVGAGGTGSIGNVGTNGNTSSVTFGSSLSANGGNGGAGNGTNTAPVGNGGAAGTFAGGNGGSATQGVNGPGGGGGSSAGTASAGNNGTSSAPGAAVTNGGAGGSAGAQSINGTAGSAPGGGAGGGGDKAGATNTAGGNGAAGQVIISYFLLTSTSNVTVCTNTAATITLSGTAVNLPVGSYTVLYDLGSPNSSVNNSATMTVSAAGTGTFSTVSLSNSGTTSLTITSITATLGGITYGTVYNNSGNANNSATITVNGVPTTATNTSTQTICLTGTATLAGNTPGVGTGAWSVVSGPSLLTSQFSSLTNPTAVFTPAGGAGSYVVRWTISNAPCTASTAEATITVSPVTVAGAVSGGTTICSSSTSALLTLSGQTGSVIQWESAISPFSSWTTITNTTATYTSGALTQTTQFRAVVQSGSCATLNSTPTTVTIGGSTTWNGSVWSSGAPTSTSAAIIAGNYTSATNGGGFSACTLTVTSGAVIISSGDNVTLNGALTVTSGSFTLENNANLIQITDTANSGNIIVNRNTAALMRQDYVMWSAPVAGQQLQAFSPQTLSNRFYAFDGSLGSAGQYVATAATGNFSSGTGYLIRMPNNHPATPTVWSGTFTGVPKNGPVTFNSLNANQYYSIGNPYPSTIDADEFIIDNSLTDPLYFWRKTNNAATSSYATYTLAGGVSNSGGDPLGLIPNGFIQVGQGFIARVPTGGSSLAFTNTMRLGNNGNQFLRTQFERSRYWLNLTDDTGFFGQMMVAYMTGATNGYDPAIDGLFFGDSDTALTSIVDNQEYVIQGRALPFETTDTVTLGFKSELGGNYTIALNNFDGLFDTQNQDIYLKDNLTNTRTNLKVAPYLFTTVAGVFNDRFEVVYENFLGVEQPKDSGNNIVVYKQNQEVVINSGSINMSKVQLYDIRGRLMVEKDNLFGSEVRMHVGKTNQVLIVKITTSTGEIVTKKIVH